MKKPLILLVDDDRGVLDALEAELRPAFEEIARIEVFDDPRVVLEALPGWAAEGRAIAVAIVDQRMPYLTGVGLLLRLRESARDAAAGAGASASTGTSPGTGTSLGASAGPGPGTSPGTSTNPGIGVSHPAAHMRTIMLTGYSDLELTIAAKNEAGVDRYVEKPWDPRVLLALVRRLFSLHVNARGMDWFLAYREIVSVGELREQLRMRYEVYSQSPDLVYLLPRTSKRMALDEYDAVSRFYGMFRVELDGEAQVGGLRVMNAPNPDAGRAVVTLAHEDPALLERARRPLKHPIELPAKWPDPEAVLRLIAEFQQRGERFVEIGRLVVAPTERGHSLTPGLVILAMLEGTASTVGVLLEIENTLQTCSARHQAAYGRVGFRVAAGTQPTFFHPSGETRVCLHARMDHLPAPVRSRVESIAQGTRSRGFACRCATFPSCLGGPYEAAAFAATDLYCPALARDRLRPAGAADIAQQAAHPARWGD